MLKPAGLVTVFEMRYAWIKLCLYSHRPGYCSQAHVSMRTDIPP